MLWDSFEKDRNHLLHQFDRPAWDAGSGQPLDELTQKVDCMAQKMADQPLPLIKAKLFAMILQNGQIDVDPRDFFTSRLNHGSLLIKLRSRWIQTFIATHMPEQRARERKAWSLGAYRSEFDFGHTAPDWDDVLRLGVPGLLKRICSTREQKAASGTLSAEQAVFYESAEIVYRAFAEFLMRLSHAAASAAQRHPDHAERMQLNAICLKNLTEQAPKTLYEALQLSFIYHELQEEIEGERLRSMGGMDRLYRSFYEDDLANGRLTREQAKTLFKYYFVKFYALTGDQLYGQPLFAGGIDPQGACVVNDLSWVILEAADELSLPNPKMHIRLSLNTPLDFIAYCCDMIRRGNSSLVFLNDEVVVKALRQTGVTVEEARNYVPIGCYEPAVLGREVPCTGSASMNLAKAVEMVLYRGIDPLSGQRIGMDTGPLDNLVSFDDFYTAVKQQIAYFLDIIVETLNEYEQHYMLLNPSPLFSSTMDECVADGRDAYAGGAKYNNSSVNFGGLGSTVDSLMAIKKLVYEQDELTLSQMRETLSKNWSGSEMLRRKVLIDPDKWGNNREKPDRIAAGLADTLAALLNNRPNGRKGVYKSGLYSIDRCFYFGARTGALPDGRLAGQPLSKNLSAVTTMDREGVTALIDSVTKIDLSQFPNGSVLDILLHPSAVRGRDGLNAFTSLVQTYFKRGGFAIHANVFDAGQLRAAQDHPDEYANMQVRVCGWNVYFVNLNRQEQDEFIRQAEHAIDA
jgi:formate C-acetyltransferase